MFNMTGWENQVCDLADFACISYGEAERQLLATVQKVKTRLTGKKEATKKEVKAKAPKEPSITYTRVIKICKDAGADCSADNPDMEMADSAYDIADCLLCDPQIEAATIKNYRKFNGTTPSRQIMKEMLADYIYDGSEAYCAKKSKK